MVVTPNDNIPQKYTNVPVQSPNYRKRVWQSFWHNPMGIMGMIGIIAIILFTFVGPLFYTASAYQTHIQHLISPPSAIFPLGTDALGRNSLARLMLGGQLSLEVGFGAAIATMIIGVVYGLVAGIWGGKIDSVNDAYRRYFTCHSQLVYFASFRFYVPTQCRIVDCSIGTNVVVWCEPSRAF